MKTFITCSLLFFLIIYRPVSGNCAINHSVSSLNEDDSVKIFKLLTDARVFASQRDYEKAVEAALKAAAISESADYEYGKYRSYMSLEIFYRDAGKLIVSAKYKLKALKSQSRLEAINYERDERERIEKSEKERRIREQQKQLEIEQEELKLKMEEIAMLERDKKISKGELDKRKYEIARRQVEIENKKQTIDIQRETINSTFNQLSLTIEELETQRLHAKIFDDSLKLVKRNEEVLKISDEKQKLINYLYLVGLSGFIILAAFIYRMYSVKSGMQELLLSKNKEIETEKNRIDGLLLNMLPMKVSETLKNTGQYAPRLFEKATVMVIGLRAVSDDPHFVTSSKFVEELDTAYKAFEEIAERNNLERVRSVGSTCVFVSGIPSETEYNNMNVVRAAIEMQNIVTGLALERKLQKQPYLDIVGGIHTGPAIAGIIGSRFTFDIWGETILSATEIEKNAQNGKIVLSDTTYVEIREKVDCTPLGEFTVLNEIKTGLYTLNFIREI